MRIARTAPVGPAGAGGSRAPRPTRSWTASVLAATVLAPMIMLGASAWLSWTQAWRAAEAEVASAADAAAQYARRLLESQLLRIGRANDLLDGLTDAGIRTREAELHARLREIAAERESAESQAFYLFVHDRDATPLVAGNLFPVPRAALPQREFNRALRGPDAPPFHVSALIVGRDTGRPYFAVAARRERTGNGLPPGAYDGIINASIYADRINTQLAALAVRPGDVVTLLRADGAVLARSTGFAAMDPAGLRLPPGSSQLPVMARGEERAVLRDAATMEAVPSLGAFRRVEGGWPVYASILRDRSAVVSAWWRGLAPQVALAIASTALLLLLTSALARRQRALLAANARLEERVAERTAALAENERFLRLAQQASGAAAWSWQPGTGEIRVSPELLGLLGLGAGSDGTRPAGPLLFSGFMAAVHPADRPRLDAALAQALQHGSMSVEIRVFRQMPDGGREERWLLCRAGRSEEAEDGPVTLYGVDLDITERKRAEERFEAATTALEGFVYEIDLPARRLRASAGIEALLGAAMPAEMAAWQARLHPEDLARLRDELRRLFADPAVDRYALEYRLRREDGAWIWVLDRGRIFRDPQSGQAVRMVGGAVNITGRRDAEERQALLMREVDHRAKNALAVVQAALRLTRAPDVEGYRAAIESRVAALARAQAMLAETNWMGTDLGTLVQAGLAPFDGGDRGRIVLEGPPVTLAAGATQPLSMALHELGTNAVKYGALSRPEGRLRVRWAMRDGHLAIGWEETGGPPLPRPPARRGFGTRVIDSTVGNQLGGAARLDWREDGLRAEITIPAERALAQAA